MRLATWNVNSIRARVDRVVDYLERSDIDVLLMQETKCKPEQLPVAPFAAAGYEVVSHGLSQWNGVAIASRVGIADVELAFPGQPAFGKPGIDPVVEARAIGATCGPLRAWSVYVPNGRGLADPHYAYKRAFLTELAGVAASWTSTPVMIGGDFNVAPTPTDIWDEADAEAVTHVTEEVRQDLAKLESAGFEELSRRFIPDERRYTFWDYKQLRFPRNEGMRIDFVYASPAAAEAATGCVIDRDERKGKGASDHVPVVIDLDTALLPRA
ncbi:exodeoxyribonuclease III [Demequina sp. TTPB684]|uniref:exodeoxyribonuclease III n=1 Tax=unclassified Demequina TaxID=2620311 RepID=UPI001CF464A6|nr:MULTISPECIES: exodeoxyribonuclease III [unclassified Demequina]MCB2412473.1 exodeoxyribonuclease III [Demequina sp. TTPB684]UPU87694.1 exodeoxyribonuclease III [Demequina sp. TMPB413]